MRPHRLTFRLSCVPFVLALTFAPACAEPPTPNGNAVIKAAAGESEIVITTTNRLAGAIDSLTWNGQEFINSADHGRQLQSAANFDLETQFTGETFNPTEAGSRTDGAGPKSTSRLLYLVASKNTLQTTNQMAFWLTPGQTSAGNLAKNKQRLSNHLVTKRVRIGYRNLPHVIQYDVTFGMPVNERHNYAQFEAVTGYMPLEFRDFWAFDAKSGKLTAISDGPGEQSKPVVLSTANGSHAMGVYSPQQPSFGFKQAGYGRFRFERAKVVKWNCVFRIRDPQGVKPGDYSYRMFVIVGDKATVTKSLQALHREFNTAKKLIRR